MKLAVYLSALDFGAHLLSLTKISKILPRTGEREKKRERERGKNVEIVVRMRTKRTDKEAFSYKLSGRSADIINLLRSRSPRANHRHAFNLGIHKYHDAERLEGILAKAGSERAFGPFFH